MRTLTTTNYLSLLLLLAVQQKCPAQWSPSEPAHKQFVESVLLVQNQSAVGPFADVVRAAAALRGWPAGSVDERMEKWARGLQNTDPFCQTWSGTPCAQVKAVRLEKAPLLPVAFVNRYDQASRDEQCGADTMAGAEIRFAYSDADKVHLIVEVVLGCRKMKQLQSEMVQWARPKPPTPISFLRALRPDEVEDIRLRLMVNPGGGSLWRASEFHFFSDSLSRTELARELEPKRTPDWERRFLTWVRKSEENIKGGNYTLPQELVFPGQVYGGPIGSNKDPVLWLPSEKPGDEELRHILSLNRCRGCHGGETGTEFIHIGPKLSGFLTGYGNGRISIGKWTVAPRTEPPKQLPSYEYNELLRRHEWWHAFLTSPSQEPAPSLRRFDHAYTRGGRDGRRPVSAK